MLADTAFPPPEKPLSFTCVPTAAVAGIKVAFVERRLFGGDLRQHGLNAHETLVASATLHISLAVAWTSACSSNVSARRHERVKARADAVVADSRN